MTETRRKSFAGGGFVLNRTADLWQYLLFFKLVFHFLSPPLLLLAGSCGFVDVKFCHATESQDSTLVYSQQMHALNPLPKQTTVSDLGLLKPQWIVLPISLSIFLFWEPAKETTGADSVLGEATFELSDVIYWGGNLCIYTMSILISHGCVVEKRFTFWMKAINSGNALHKCRNNKIYPTKDAFSYYLFAQLPDQTNLKNIYYYQLLSVLYFE